jgi:hypothetical protein
MRDQRVKRELSCCRFSAVSIVVFCDVRVISLITFFASYRPVSMAGKVMELQHKVRELEGVMRSHAVAIQGEG